MPRWDRLLDHPESPYRQAPDATESLELPPALAGKPLEGEAGLWLYLVKGMAIFLLGGLLLSNAMYAAFELISLLAGAPTTFDAP